MVSLNMSIFNRIEKLETVEKIYNSKQNNLHVVKRVRTIFID